MNIKGIGIDIEEVGRFRKLPYKSNLSFYRNIFTPAEIKYCLSKADPHPHFTVRFAAKEAVIKAMGGSVFKAKDIEVVNNREGRPSIKLQTPGSKPRVLVSMSHTKDYAIAFVIWLN